MIISVGIVGATGYAGEELIGVLLRHPNVRITYLCAKIDKAKPISEIFPKFKGKIDLVCKLPQIYEILNKSELLFLALPHTVSMKFAPQLLKAGKRVIDLSADYRLKQLNIYEKYYKCRHTDRAGIQDSVYGLPELYRAKIKKAKLIANPGCYPTGAILALAPLAAFNLADLNSIIIDAKSGVTGAGRKANFETFFSELNEDFKAYKVNKHQHMPEINQEISKLAGRKIQVTFVPHLLPLNRGILSTIYVKRSHKVTGAEGHKLTNLYKKFYKKEPFVRIREDAKLPQLKDVVGTNFCDIGIVEESDKIIIICALDNLMKGASGQAVQNMNIMYGFPEHMGLI